MSDTHDHSGLPEDELVAAEFALGALAGIERAAAEARVAQEPAFARLVAAWEERLAPWVSEIDEVAPPPHVWDHIAATLPPPSQGRRGLWQNLTFWRGFGLASALAAACLALVVYSGTFNRAEPLVATIGGGGQNPSFVATVDAKRATIVVMPATFTADVNGRVPELWLIPADGKPRALGLLRAERSVTIAVPVALSPLTTRNAVLAVSLEPPGGSPTAQPTGPVIASGKLENL